MAQETIKTDTSQNDTEQNSKKSKIWLWLPELPIKCGSPLFDLPPNILKIIAYWLTGGWLLSVKIFFLITAWLTLNYAMQPIESYASFASNSFSDNWLLHHYLRNFAMMVVVVGGLHVLLYKLKWQNDIFRFDPRPFSKNHKLFTFNDQVWDNMFWTLTSGVLVWTAYEAVMLWAYANGYMMQTSFAENPIWFCALFLILPTWQSIHFFFIHRALHWKPLYRLAHAIHHRNTNIGPWSGFSMHPIEHILYLSYIFIIFMLPIHPLHIIFMLQFNSVGTAIGHAGFESLVIFKRLKISLSPFDHQLHHRYFDCNYGNAAEVPLDKWAGTFHDGTNEGMKHMRSRQKKGRRSF